MTLPKDVDYINLIRRLPDPHFFNGRYFEFPILTEDTGWEYITFELYKLPQGLTWRLKDVSGDQQIALIFGENKMTQTAQQEVQAARESLEEAQRRLEAAEEQLKKGEQWEPKEGRYYLDLFNKINFVVNADLDERYSNTSCRHFPTEKSAEIAAKNLRNIMVLSQIAADLNGDWEPDLLAAGDLFYIEYHKTAREWVVASYRDFRPTTVYFKDKETSERACKILNNQPDLIEL
ncbi:hypothetical protein [Marinicella marina]|uniref:hypothetical protein n=1 Tax=Marinicella marina TaxID=2996016 RepID=UPI0024BCCD8E|nr:hypothetical protein [Marinicella marina]MDJ1139652.1 hypothetical protein [Marinicella marina]